MQTIRYGGDYNPEQWPEEIWHEDVRLMREAGVNLVSLGIFNWGIIEPAPGEYDWTGLDEIIALLHANGIGVDLGTPTSAPPSWLRRAHPEIRLVDFEGRTMASGSRHGLCPSHPVYNDACASIVEQLAARYGAHPAVEMWHLHNEYGWANVQCYCEVSAAHFRRWLAEKYGDVDRLNASWGTAFWGLVYRDFDQIEAPSVAPPGVNPALQLDWMRFSNDAHIANYRLQREIIARHSEAPATTNFMVPNCKDMDYFRWAEHVDVVSNNHYLIAERAEHEIELSMSADLTRAVANGPWMVMEHSTSAVNWQPRNIAKTPGELRRNSLAHVARGADGLMFFQWRASRAGAEKFHSAMLPHGGTDTQVWRDVVALGSDLKRLAAVVGSDVTAEVAVLWDWESWWALELEWRPSVELQFRERVEAYYASLWKQHVTVDFAHPEADLGRYKAVIAPSSYLLTAAAAKNLRGYVGRRRASARLLLLRHRRRARHRPSRSARVGAAGDARPVGRGVPPGARGHPARPHLGCERPHLVRARAPRRRRVRGRIRRRPRRGPPGAHPPPGRLRHRVVHRDGPGRRHRPARTPRRSARRGRSRTATGPARRPRSGPPRPLEFPDQPHRSGPARPGPPGH